MSEPARRALELLGKPYRFRGREPSSGLDCLGVVLHAFSLRGSDLPPYNHCYSDWTTVENLLRIHFEPAQRSEPEEGDLLVIANASHFHFGVVGIAGLIHADRRFGRVIQRRIPERLGSGMRLYTIKEQ